MANTRATTRIPDLHEAPAFDMLVLTAANEQQARGYRAQLGARARMGLLNCCRRWCVIADPRGRRIGSGGATVHALARLAALHARRPKRNGSDLFEHARILIIHSGGDSRRLPAFAAQGKAFVPLPLEDDRGRRLALLDLILDDFAGCRLGDGGRVIVASGDVYLGLRQEQVDLSGSGVLGVAFRGSLARGSRHGVYALDHKGRVRNVMQKPTAAAARSLGAVDRHGRVLIDAGVVAFDPAAARTLLRCAGVHTSSGVAASGGLLGRVQSGAEPALDLYADVLPAIVRRDGARLAWPRGARGRLRVRLLNRCPFWHMGTTREVLRMSARLARGKLPRSRRVIALDAPASHVRGGNSALLYACAQNGRWSLRGDNVLANIPHTVVQAVRLPRGIGLVGLPIDARHWAFVAFGADDDCKTSVSGGGACCGFPLTRLVESGWDPWREQDRAAQTLWNARLWHIGGADDSVRAALDVARMGRPRDAMFAERRWSLQELMPKVSHERLIDHQSECARMTHVSEAGARLTRCPWWALDDLLAEVRSARDRADALKSVEDALRQHREPLTRARLLRAQQRLQSRHRSADRSGVRSARSREDAPFACIARAVESAVHWCVTRPEATNATPLTVTVECPARIDLAGGWTDTPPMCQELGGAVVNVAVDVEDGPPIKVACNRLDEPILRVRSLDLGFVTEYSRAQRLARPLSPGDWTSLPRAALTLTGFAPPRSSMALERWLTHFGGLELVMHSALPKGSGLGTSSILGAAVVAALLRMRGEPQPVRTLTNLTSVLEQRLSTGGGWQDQAGGITPGAKLLRSQPGNLQVPRSLVIPGAGCLGAASARGQFLLYFTGRQRLAKDILRQVVGRYLDRDPAMRGILHRLTQGAISMHRAIEHGTLAEVGAILSEYWHLKKRIHPGAANRTIDAMFARVAPLVHGACVAGAGDGGFALLIAKNGQAAGAIREVLSRHPPHPDARFVDCTINNRGIVVRAQ